MKKILFLFILLSFLSYTKKLILKSYKNVVISNNIIKTKPEYQIKQLREERLNAMYLDFTVGKSIVALDEEIFKANKIKHFVNAGIVIRIPITLC